MAKKPGRSASSSPSIPLSEYVARREAVLKALGDSVALVCAGEGGAHLRGIWEPSMDFYYLTGIKTEAGAAVLFDPRNPDPARRCVLILRPMNPELDQWDGFRDQISGAMRAATGFSLVQRTTHLPRAITAAARRQKKLACLHPFAVYEAGVSDDLRTFRKITERVLGVAIEDRTNLLPSMRAVKSEHELAMMARAVEGTAAGYAEAVRAIRPGVSERTIHQILEHQYSLHGCHRSAYNPIVGAGKNAAVLHYHDNDRVMESGDLLLIDSAGEFEHYCADVTRTYPISGKFSADQREVYELVLKAQEAAIKLCRPGVWMWEIDAAVRAIFDKAGMGDHYPHGIGHQLGLEVHDATPDGPLVAGMVVTIEPGIYIADRRIGVRIEDDILITKSGPKNLTHMIPKSVRDVEAAMR
jgi:Xaa-Pro aminopeptidase